MFSRISTFNLALASSIGGAITLGFGVFVRNDRTKKITSLQCYQDTLKILKDDPGAKHLMGPSLYEQEWQSSQA